METKEKIKNYFNGQRESYDLEAEHCVREAKQWAHGSQERKYYETRAWNCSNMVLKMTSIQQSVLKLV